MNGSTITNHQRVRRIETYPVCTVDARSLNLNSHYENTHLGVSHNVPVWYM